MQLDTNVLVRHVTGEPPAQAKGATALLRRGKGLELADLILAELVYVLESVYRRPRNEVAAIARSLLGMHSIDVPNRGLLRRAVEIYDVYHVHFAEAYLSALAEGSDGAVVSFDRDLDRIGSIRRIEP